jgi:thioredoxin-related protein
LQGAGYHIAAPGSPGLGSGPLAFVTEVACCGRIPLLWSGLLIGVLAAAPIRAEAAQTALQPEDGDDQALFFEDSPRLREFEHPPWFKDSFLELPADLAEAAAAGKRGIIVYFGQENCAYCMQLMEVNFGKPDIAEYTRRNFDVIEIDIWGSREVLDVRGERLGERDFAVREGTNFTPSLIFYDTDGEEALRLRGYYPPYRFRAALHYVVEGFYRRESFRDYLARADPPPKFELGDLNEDPLFSQPPHALDRSRFAASRPLVVFFEQFDCHACDVLHTDPLSDAHTRELLRRFEVRQLDMWSDQPVLTPDGQRRTAQAWADELGIIYAPTLVFFDEQGREIIRIGSVVQLYRLQGVLEYVASKAYLEYPTYQRWRRAMRAQAGSS